ncbi:unnamed protein product, partial [Laminaria digitata]
GHSGPKPPDCLGCLTEDPVAASFTFDTSYLYATTLLLMALLVAVRVEHDHKHSFRCVLELRREGEIFNMCPPFCRMSLSHNLRVVETLRVSDFTWVSLHRP